MYLRHIVMTTYEGVVMMMMTYCEYIMTIIDRNLIKIPDFRIPAGSNGFQRDSARFCSLRLDHIMLMTMMDMMTILTMIYKEELAAGWERLSVLAKLVDYTG